MAQYGDKHKRIRLTGRGYGRMTDPEREGIAAPYDQGAMPMPVGEALVRAVLAHQVIGFDYGGGRRIVEPHLVGLHEAGEVVLLAYQLSGFSASGPLPGWRTFVLAEIDGVRPEGRTFSAPRPGFKPEAHRMVEIFARA